MVSIVVPVYNAEKFINRCVDSLLAQTYQDFEILLVDDGSSDDSFSICKSYEQKDSRVIAVHKENGGVSSARNFGMELARGEWIGFVDADDNVYPRYLGSYFNLGDEADLLIQGYKQINVKDGSTSYYSEPDSIIKAESMMPYILKTQKTWHLGYVWCKLFRSEIIKIYQLKFDTSIHQCEDLLFCISYLQYVKILNNISVNDQYVYFRVSSQGRYKKQDQISLQYKLYYATCRINAAQGYMPQILGLYSHNILSYYIYGDNRYAKNKHIDEYLSTLYAYRFNYNIKDYRLICRIFLFFSKMTDNFSFTKILLHLFSYNPLGK